MGVGDIFSLDEALREEKEKGDLSDSPKQIRKGLNSTKIGSSFASPDFPEFEDAATFEIYQLRDHIRERDGVIVELEGLLREQGGNI